MSTARQPAILVIGASAGGITPVAECLAALPSTAPLAVIVAQHLSAHRPSNLVEILQRHTALRVRAIAHGDVPEAGTVGVVPPGFDVQLRDGRLLMNVPEQRVMPAPSIDVVLTSVAESEARDRAIAVILSGMGADGAEGLRLLSEHGGLGIAQLPAEAGSPDMPEAALRTGRVDLVESTRRFGPRLADLARTLLAPVSELSPAILATLDSAMRQWGSPGTGRFSAALLARSVQLRAALKGESALPAYADLVAADPAEAEALLRRLLDPQTSFNAQRADRASVLSALRAAYLQWSGPGPFRAWSVGCASGEEAYAMAIEMEECRLESGSPPYRVHGTDLLSDRISLARAGVYSRFELRDLDVRLQQRYFVPRLRHQQVRLELRRTLLFSVHDALEQPPIPHVSFIACNGLAPRLSGRAAGTLRKRLLGALGRGGVLVLDGCVHHAGDPGAG